MANSVERVGVSYCSLIAEKMGWMFREQPIDDIGIDAHIEFTEETGTAKQLLGLQIKSGKSWFKNKSGNYIIFRDIDERKYNYWTTNSLPCIIVLYNPKDETCIWEELNSITIKKTKDGKGKGYVVKVPLNQVFLDEKSIQKFLSITNLPEYIKNYNFLVSQKKFMQIIRDGGVIKLHSKEWINKSSGKGNIEIIIEYKNTLEKYSYPYYFPFTSYTDVFSRLFPWALFSADEKFFYEDDVNLWRELNCYYDKEDDEFKIVGEGFDEFRKSLNPMRSINHGGEIAEYMLTMRLNELGKSFMIVDNFISNMLPYNKARPQKEKE